MFSFFSTPSYVMQIHLTCTVLLLHSLPMCTLLCSSVKYCVCMKPRFVFLGFSSVHVLWPLTNIVQRKNVLIKKCKINQIATIISCSKNTDLFDFYRRLWIINSCYTYFVFFICGLIELLLLHVKISIL